MKRIDSYQNFLFLLVFQNSLSPYYSDLWGKTFSESGNLVKSAKSKLKMYQKIEEYFKLALMIASILLNSDA